MKSREIVGTYRLLLGSRARKHIGFYSERKFDLEKIKRLKGKVLELGRSCARKDFRDKALISLMWQAIAKYVKKHEVRYLFGCLYTTDVAEVSEYFSMLKQKYYASEEFRVSPLAECQFADVSDNLDVNEQTVFLKVPSLIRGYLKLGAVVCGPPALDGQFDTGDFSSVIRRS